MNIKKFFEVLGILYADKNNIKILLAIFNKVNGISQNNGCLFFNFC